MTKEEVIERQTAGILRMSARPGDIKLFKKYIEDSLKLAYEIAVGDTLRETMEDFEKTI